jgi:(p)ppGpp synthase/HD superfamily hydrolase
VSREALVEAVELDAAPLPEAKRGEALFSRRYDAALILSAAAHSVQNRKGTSIPYSAHPVHVARLLEQAGVDDEGLLIAGLLHDVLEDL